jgi:hypothetical protein
MLGKIEPAEQALVQRAHVPRHSARVLLKSSQCATFKIRCAMFSEGLTRSLPAMALLSGALLMPSRSDACSYAMVVVESSYPEAGAVDVPTNAVPFVYGPELNSTSDVELVDEDGRLVPVEARVVTPTGIDLIPVSDLAPNHRYELRAVGSIEAASIKFTTGAGPAAVSTQLPPPALDVRLLKYALGTCGELSGICIEASHPSGTTLEVRIGDEVLSGGAGSPWPRYRAYGQPLADSDCIEVRARDVRGNRSEPTMACGESLKSIRLTSNIPDSGYACDNYSTFVEPSGGDTSPSAVPGNAGANASAGPATALDDDLGAEQLPSSAPSGCALAAAGGIRWDYGNILLGAAALLAARRRIRA